MPSTPTPEDDYPSTAREQSKAGPDIRLVCERIVRTTGENIRVFYPRGASEEEKLTQFIVADERIVLDRRAMR